MPPEESQIEAVAAAPESEVTATPETVETETPEVAEPRVFTQEELDAKVGERLAKERRKWERDAQKQAAEARPVPVTPPDPKQFTSQEAYTKAVIDHQVEATISQREAQKHQNEGLLAHREREEDALAKYEDYNEVTYGEGSRITPEMAQVIIASDIGPEIAYHLGKNRDEARRISNLSPLLQAREIGKIEAKLITNPTASKTSSAPDPIKTVGSRSTPPKYETTDPRSLERMSTTEWINAENRRRLKQQQG